MKRTVMKGVIVSTLLATSINALAEPTCTDAPQSEWMSEAEIKQKIAEMGYKVKEFKITDGSCYEIYGWDSQERRVEIYFNPVNGEIVKQKVD